MNFNYIYWILFLISSSCSTINKNNNLKLTHHSVLSSESNWIAEIQDKENSSITYASNYLEIDVAKGATIWFKEMLQGNVLIEYDVTVISNGGVNDRVSDLNCFWMFSNPNEKGGSLNFNDNTRNGKFNNYHTLQGYYVGLGGHNNTKTRFRRYNGNAKRNLLPEHDLSDIKHLIIPNKKYHIQLNIIGDKVQYIRDDKVVFEYTDEDVLKKGWFGFRTVTNHMLIENFIIFN